MNKFIRIKMDKTASGIGGSFNLKADFKLDNVPVPFHNVTVKIDTGCSISTIPLQKTRIPKMLCKIYKMNDIKGGVPYLFSYGVETGGQKHDMPKTDDEKLGCKAMKFCHGISDFALNGVSIADRKIYINYDRSGNILIGMDILSTWDIHIGTISTGETVFMGCPKEMVCSEYLIELEKTFGIGTTIMDAAKKASGNSA